MGIRNRKNERKIWEELRDGSKKVKGGGEKGGVGTIIKHSFKKNRPSSAGGKKIASCS